MIGQSKHNAELTFIASLGVWFTAAVDFAHRAHGGIVPLLGITLLVFFAGGILWWSHHQPIPPSAPPAEPMEPTVVQPTITPSATDRVLLIDDNAVSRAVTRQLLRSQQVPHDAVTSAAAAQLALDQTAHGLVLVKLPMANGNGLTLAQRLRGPHNLQLPIVGLLTGWDSDLSQKYQEVGFHEVLATPLTDHSLAIVIDRWLHQPLTKDITAIDTALPPEVLTIDTSILAEYGYTDDEEDELRDFVELFLKDATLKCETLHAAIRNQESSVVARIAHAMKGSSAVAGASKVSYAAAVLEEAGHHRSQLAIQQAFKVLEIELKRVRERFIRQILKAN